MKNKALHLINNHDRHTTGWLRAMRESSEPEEAQFKDARRLRAIFPWLDDWDRFRGSFNKYYRNWKNHSKCRHQWEKHEFTVSKYPDGVVLSYRNHMSEDHYRDWILECLRQKKTCVFDLHHDGQLEDAITSCGRGAWTYSYINHGDRFMEVTLVKQTAKHPHKKTSPGDKGTKGKYHRRHEQRNRQNTQQEVIDAVAERTRRASRKADDGIVFAPLPTKLFVPQSLGIVINEAPKLGNTLHDKAIYDHINGITRSNSKCQRLLACYSLYSSVPQAHRNLAPYEHDYHQFTNELDQCCAWLTGHSTREFPVWVMKLLTCFRVFPIIDQTIANRIFKWTIGGASVRDCYGLSKNEAREIVHLHGRIENEQQAIAVAIGRARHCGVKLSINLGKQLPGLCNLLDASQREFVRNLAEWLAKLPVAPDREHLHDLLDFFFLSRLFANPLFSFKGRTLQSIERMMHEWHLQQQQEQQSAIQASLMQKWPYRGYDYDYTYQGTYHFHELCSGQALMSEGQAQHNCVFSYHTACISGRTSIVSMHGSSPSEHLTIEINNNTRSIVQIRGVCNRPPANAEMRIVNAYASVKNLSINC